MREEGRTVLGGDSPRGLQGRGKYHPGSKILALRMKGKYPIIWEDLCQHFGAIFVMLTWCLHNRHGFKKEFW